MSAISSVYANNFDSVKIAKENFVNQYVNNHPNRLSVLRFTGTLNIEFDGRNSALVTGLTTNKTNTDYDFSTFPEWTRRFNEQLPTLFGLAQFPTPSGHGLEKGEFYVFQEIYYFWRFGIYFGLEYDPVKVGESTTIYYERDTVDDPWVETSTESSDIETIWIPYIGDPVFPAENQGGDPISGGRGPDDNDNSVAFGAWPSAVSDLLNGVVVYRLPWDVNWENESDIFADHIADYIAANNEDDEGGWTGSTTIALEFS